MDDGRGHGGAWSGRFAALNALPSALYGGLILAGFAAVGAAGEPVVVALSIALAVAFWAVSTGLRAVVLARGWLGLGTGPLLARLALAVLVGSFLVQAGARLALVASAALGWIGPLDDRYGAGAALAYTLQVAIVLALWTALWIGLHLLRERRRSEIARLRAESQRNALELDALRARLNPHFVFNALNNLRALILEDPQRARELVTRLSNTLRHALEHSQGDAVALREELAVVDDYLAIEAVHYEGRLRVERGVPPDALDARLPPMAVQLLVENAIKHGIARTPGGGTLALRATLHDAMLRVEVDNPGRLDDGDRTGAGVGLAYLRARLARDARPGRLALDDAGGRVRAALEIPQ